MKKKNKRSVIDKVYGAKFVKPMRDKRGNRVFFIYQTLTIFNNSTSLKHVGQRQLGQTTLGFKEALRMLKKYANK